MSSAFARAPSGVELCADSPMEKSIALLERGFGDMGCLAVNSGRLARRPLEHICPLLALGRLQLFYSASRLARPSVCSVD